MMRSAMAYIKLSILAFVIMTALTFAGILYFLILRVQGAETAQAIGPYSLATNPAGTGAFIATLVIAITVAVLSVIVIALKLIYARTSNRQFYLAGATIALVIAYCVLVIEMPVVYLQYSTIAQWFIIGVAFVAYLVFGSFCVYEWRRHEAA